MNRVIKIGSSSLFDSKAQLSLFDAIASLVSSTLEKDKTVIVSSGAIAFGKSILGVHPSKTLSIPEQQANAAVGQPTLMSCWSQSFAKHGLKVAQVLVTNEVLTGRLPEQKSHLEDVFSELFKAGIVPIVNENDAVAVAEIVQGDNDRLSAHIANIVGAQELYILGTANAIYEDYLSKNGRISQASLEDIEKLKTVSSGTNDTQAKGGMITKIEAALIFLNEDNTENDKKVYIAGAKGKKELSFKNIAAEGTRLTLKPIK